MAVAFFNTKDHVDERKVEAEPKTPSCETDWKACADNAEVVNKNWKALLAVYKCKDKANEMAKFGQPQWPWHSFAYFTRGKSYLEGSLILLVDKDVKFQNGFGVYGKVTVRCLFDLKSDSVIDVTIDESP